MTFDVLVSCPSPSARMQAEMHPSGVHFRDAMFTAHHLGHHLGLRPALRPALRRIHFSKLERLLWTHKKSLALQRVLHTHKERLPLQRETCFSTPAFIDALIIPYHHSSSINSIPYRVMLVAMRIIFLGTEMRMLITSYEISIKTEAKRHDGPPHLGTYG